MDQLVFVYGSLKRGLLHHDQLDGAVYRGSSSVRGYRLVLYEDSYPALVPAFSTDQKVSGELFELDSDHLERLDLFEDVPELYERTVVTLTDGRQAWAYVIDVERARNYPSLDRPWQGT